jgi:hypothetical protein
VVWRAPVFLRFNLERGALAGDGRRPHAVKKKRGPLFGERLTPEGLVLSAVRNWLRIDGVARAGFSQI